MKALLFAHDSVGWLSSTQLFSWNSKSVFHVVWIGLAHVAAMSKWVGESKMVTHMFGPSAGMAGKLGPLYSCTKASFTASLFRRLLQQASPDLFSQWLWAPRK